MLPVILAIAICLSFIITIAVVRFSFASTRESPEIRQQRAQTLTKPLTLLSITDAVDPIYSILWEAPIAALELIDSAGPAAYKLPDYNRYLSNPLRVSGDLRRVQLCAMAPVPGTPPTRLMEWLSPGAQS
jgi:hypothetical protein